MKKNPHPSTVPLNKWPDGWLKMSVAHHIDVEYIFATDEQKKANSWPLTHDEMVAFLIEKNDIPAAGTGLD